MSELLQGASEPPPRGVGAPAKGRRIAHWGVAVLETLAARCPKGLVQGIATALAPLVWLIARKERLTFFENVSHIFGLPPHSHFSKMFGHQVTRHQVHSFLEVFKGISDGNSLKIEGQEQLDSVVASLLAGGRGLIIATAHLGSWELVGHAVGRSTRSAGHGTFHVLAKPQTSDFVTTLLETLRVKMGTTVLWVDKKSLLKDMLQVLKDGGALGFVMDQKPLARRGPLVTFFSQETPFVSGPASLAIRQGSPLLCVFCLRTGPFSYRLFWEIALRADHNQSDETQVTGILSTEIEKYIRLYPEQWTWNYRRWRWTEKSGGTPQKSH